MTTVYLRILSLILGSPDFNFVLVAHFIIGDFLNVFRRKVLGP